MPTANEQLVIDFLVSPTGQKALDDIGKSAEKSAAKVEALKNVLIQATAQTGASAEEAISAARQYAEIQKQALSQLQTPEVFGGGSAKMNTGLLNQIEGMSAAQSAAHKKKMAETEEEAVLEAAKFNEKKSRMVQEQNLYKIMAQERARLREIERLAPYDQINALKNLVPGMARSSGVPVQTLMKEIETGFNVSATTGKKVVEEIRNMENGLIRTGKEAFNVKSIFNNLFSATVIGGLFSAIFMITEVLKKAVTQANDFRQAIIKLSVVENVLSRGGVEVTGKQLLDIVSELESKFILVSHIDMLKATAQTALRMADIGLSTEQLKAFLEVANVAQISNPGQTLPDISEKLGTAVLTGEQKSVRDLGFHISEQETKQKAVELGLIKDINSEMTEQVKITSRIALLHDQAILKMEETLGMQNNLAFAGEKFQKSWSGLIEVMSPLADWWNSILYITSYIIDGLVVINKLLSGTAKPTNEFQKSLVEVFKVISNIINFANKEGKSIPTMIYEKLSGKKIKDQTPEALALKDTPTGEKPIPSDKAADDSEKNATKIKDALTSLSQTIEDFGDRARKMEEDFQIAMEQMVEDFQRAQIRMWQDYMHDRQKIYDDAARKIIDKEREHNEKKKNDEKKFQEELRQLRERYLMDVNEAAHERDARAVLRLAREYAMNRRNMINEHNNRVAQDDETHRRDMEDIIRQRDDRLRELEYEYKLKAQRAKEEHELEVKRKEADHKLDMERLEHDKQDRLREIADSLAKQLGLNAEGADAIYQLLNEYYGENGAIDGLLKFTYENSVAYTEEILKRLEEFVKKYKELIGEVVPKGNTHVYPGQEPPPTTGGTSSESVDAINKAFSSKARELSLFISARQSGAISGSGEFSNSLPERKIDVNLLLSPDLEARVVDKSLQEVANVFLRIRKER